MEKCFHCGDDCSTSTRIQFQEKSFCCHGCKLVFEILNDHNLTNYYDIENHPGTTPNRFEGKFDFLQNEEIAKKLIEFDEQGIQIVTFTIPSIHCSSCIWVLENLHKLNSAVTSTQVNFPKKTLRITYSAKEIKLFQLVELLCKIGYEPYISLDDATRKNNTIDRKLIYQLGVAGFAFGNIMFLSFPEYFEVEEFWLEKFKPIFRWLMFGFSIPVVVYSAQDYLVSAFKSLRSKMLNIDVPIALGILVLFIRSSIEILMNWGTGFFDSLAGLVFFLLLGKFFQQKTYSYLSFERDYKSYFPIAVTRLNASEENSEITEEQAQVYDLKTGDRILIRNNELIPVDCILMKGNALIDYSFVTGEAEPIEKMKGDQLYAGGRQQAGSIELQVLKPVEQSYLTQLWSNEVFSKKNETVFESLTNKVSKHFTITILSIAILATIFWIVYQPALAFNVFTAVLIVACPCAIALAAPFTLGNLLRIFGRKKYYLKNSQIIEQMAEIDTIVFDKTGTLTSTQKNITTYEGITLTEEEQSLLTSTLRESNHPLSRSLYQTLQSNNICTLDDFEEELGKGITGISNQNEIKIGSSEFVVKAGRKVSSEKNNQTAVHISSNNNYKGCFVFSNQYREGLNELFQKLSKSYHLAILSGDNNGEERFLKKLLPASTQLSFNQKPEQKLQFIKKLQSEGKKVMMVGDGLNDAGALAQSNVGIAVSENVNIFSPACDGILAAENFKKIDDFLKLSKKGNKIIKYAFIFSLFYNLIGLGFAVTGKLSPVVAAILMPLSSISIVAFTSIYAQISSKKL